MMKTRRFTILGRECRRSKTVLVALVTTFNFCVGLFIISTILTAAEKQAAKIQSVVVQSEETETIRKQTLSLSTKQSTIPRRRTIKDEYEYYFRIDYTILQGVCKPIHLFNTTTNTESLENLTNSLLNSLSRNVTIDIDVISINATLKSTDKIRQNSTYKFFKTVCNYVLELYIGVNFPSFCTTSCQSQVIERVSARVRPFGDPVDYPFTFNFYPSNSYESKVKYRVERVLLFRSTIYFDKAVYIRSYYEASYVSALILDSSAFRTSVTLSHVDRTLFYIKSGLDQVSFRSNCSTISISFLTALAHNTYLRHETGRIKLRKNDQTNLFHQDSTFRLITSNYSKDMMAFQSVNVPQAYLAVDSDTKTSLLLTEPEFGNITTIDDLEKSFIFTLVPAF